MILCLAGGGVIVGCILLEMVLAAIENFGKLSSVMSETGMVGHLVLRDALGKDDQKNDCWKPVSSAGIAER